MRGKISSCDKLLTARIQLEGLRFQLCTEETFHVAPETFLIRGRRGMLRVGDDDREAKVGPGGERGVHASAGGTAELRSALAVFDFIHW